MININNYISEKLIINKDTQIYTKEFDINDDQCKIDIIIAAVISFLNNGAYKENSVFKKELYKINQKDYNVIIDILNNEFGYDIDYEEGKLRKGKIWETVSNNKYHIQNLINGFTILLDKMLDNKDYEGQTISLKDIKEKYKKLCKR